MNYTLPGCVMVARQTLDLLVGVQILPGEKFLKLNKFFSIKIIIKWEIY